MNTKLVYNEVTGQVMQMYVDREGIQYAEVIASSFADRPNAYYVPHMPNRSEVRSTIQRYIERKDLQRRINANTRFTIKAGIYTPKK